MNRTLGVNIFGLQLIVVHITVINSAIEMYGISVPSLSGIFAYPAGTDSVSRTVGFRLSLF